MKLREWVLAVTLIVIASSALASSRIVTFEGIPAGTTFGTAAGVPVGTLVAIEDTIEVRTQVMIATGNTFYNQGIFDTGGQIGTGIDASFASLGLSFDFHGTGNVSFDFFEAGGTLNLRVNGGPLHEVGDYRALDGQVVAPGVTAQVTASGTQFTVAGTVTLQGPVTTLDLAGSELRIDNIETDGFTGGSDPGGDPTFVCDVIVDHETLSFGDAWSFPTYQPNDIIFVEDSIEVRLGEVDGGGATALNDISVAAAAGVGTGHVLNLDKATAIYDLASQGLAATQISFIYGDGGALGNLAVNNGPLFIGDLVNAPVNFNAGVTLEVVPFGTTGARRVTLVGDINHLRVGGSGFVLDDMCFVLGNGAVYGGCDKQVTADQLGGGTVWDLGNTGPGNIIFTEDAIPVRAYGLDDGSGAVLGTVTALPTTSDFGIGNVLVTEKASVAYSFTGLGLVAQVNLDFLSQGGPENLQINGGTTFIGDLVSLSGAVGGGVTALVAKLPGPPSAGYRLVLTGPVSALRIGGVSLAIDNVCVRVNGPTSSGVDETPPAVLFSLAPAYPNPFNPRTELRFTLRATGPVDFAIYNLHGQRVRTLVTAEMTAGEHVAVWRGQDDTGRLLPSGVYFASLRVGTKVETTKLALIK